MEKEKEMEKFKSGILIKIKSKALIVEEGNKEEEKVELEETGKSRDESEEETEIIIVDKTMEELKDKTEIKSEKLIEEI